MGRQELYRRCSRMGETAVDVAERLIGGAGVTFVARDVYPVAADWKAYVDNYLEEFHIPSLHGGLAERLDYSSYRTETFDHCNLQLGTTRSASEAATRVSHAPHATQISARRTASGVIVRRSYR